MAYIYPSLSGSGTVVNVTKPVSYPYTTLITDSVIAVDCSIARTINLMASPDTGRVYQIKKLGSATLTIHQAAGNIDGSSSDLTVNGNYAEVGLVYSGTEWNIL